MSATRAATAAVQGGTLVHVSASQIKSFQRCQRRWWFEKVAGIRQESTGAQSKGVSIHGQMERYYEDGTLPTEPSALKAVQSGTLPPRAEGVLIEASLTEPTLAIDGVLYKGFIDLTVPSATSVSIIDWKSASSYKYIKTPAELRTDIQMGSYAYWAKLRYPEAQSVSVSHVYLSTRAATFRTVEASISGADTDAVWADITATVGQMKVVAGLESYEAVEPNFDACLDFGGCPHFAICQSRSALYDSYEPPEPYDPESETV